MSLDQIKLSLLHPDIDEAFANGEPLPKRHPPVAGLFAAALTFEHPNVDDILADPASNPLPAWHPRIDSFTNATSSVASSSERSALVSIAFDHLNIDEAYNNGAILPKDHPRIIDLMERPMGHAEFNTLMRDPKG